MLIAADYPFFDLFWTIVVFFAWFAWIWIAVTCFIDIFRRDDIGGGHKALWVVFIIVIPFLGVLVYLIAQHDGMRERSSTRPSPTAGPRQLRQADRGRLGERDRQGQGVAGRGHDHPGRVRLDQGQGARLAAPRRKKRSGKRFLHETSRPGAVSG